MPDNRAQLAAALIRMAEGLRLTAYLDSGGIATIGYGHTTGVKLGDTCSVEQAEAWLTQDAAPLFSAVESKPTVVAAAYIDFSYNCGYTALMHVLSGNVALGSFIHDHLGNVLPGLVSRRALEQALIDAVM